MGLIDNENIKKLSAEIDNKGFFVTSTEALINWARTGSLHWMTFGLACCAIEMFQTNGPRYDLERYGAAPRGSPRQRPRASPRSVASRPARAARRGPCPPAARTCRAGGP